MTKSFIAVLAAVFSMTNTAQAIQISAGVVQVPVDNIKYEFVLIPQQHNASNPKFFKVVKGTDDS